MKIFTTFWFIIGLVALLLNDFLLKGAYGNWATGKLSDFAGLFIFPLFWTAFLPKYKNQIYAFTAAFFIFWKSSWSQPLIDSWNSLGLLFIYRTVDYTDLVGLLVLPISYLVESSKEELKSLKLPPVIPVVVAAFAFAATSRGGPIPEVYYHDAYYLVPATQQAIIARIEKAGKSTCADVNNSKASPPKYCNIEVDNDTLSHVTINFHPSENYYTVVELSSIRYNEAVLGEEDGAQLDTVQTEGLKKIFEREVLNKVIVPTPNNK